MNTVAFVVSGPEDRRALIYDLLLFAVGARRSALAGLTCADMGIGRLSDLALRGVERVGQRGQYG